MLLKSNWFTLFQIKKINAFTIIHKQKHLQSKINISFILPVLDKSAIKPVIWSSLQIFSKRNKRRISNRRNLYQSRRRDQVPVISLFVRCTPLLKFPYVSNNIAPIASSAKRIIEHWTEGLIVLCITKEYFSYPFSGGTACLIRPIRPPNVKGVPFNRFVFTWLGGPLKRGDLKKATCFSWME